MFQLLWQVECYSTPELYSITIILLLKMIALGFCLQNFNAKQALLRRTFTKALKAYGPGVASLEGIVQETIVDMVDSIQKQDGELTDVHKLCSGYVCCIVATMVRCII